MKSYNHSKCLNGLCVFKFLLKFPSEALLLFFMFDYCFRAFVQLFTVSMWIRFFPASNSRWIMDRIVDVFLHSHEWCKQTHRKFHITNDMKHVIISNEFMLRCLHISIVIYNNNLVWIKNLWFLLLFEIPAIFWFCIVLRQVNEQLCSKVKRTLTCCHC